MPAIQIRGDGAVPGAVGLGCNAFPMAWVVSARLGGQQDLSAPAGHRPFVRAAGFLVTVMVADHSSGSTNLVGLLDDDSPVIGLEDEVPHQAGGSRFVASVGGQDKATPGKADPLRPSMYRRC